MIHKRLCVIGVYFGKLPNYFQLWLESCAYNKEIDFLIFTDQKIDTYPPNFRLFSCSLDEIKEKASKVVGFSVELERAYKLCDYRPIYGYLFEEYLSEYDYWAHCDFDMIFGDIQEFCEKYRIEKYDRFLPFGHLSFYRNCKEVSDRYTLPAKGFDYRDVFSSKENFIFDEEPGMNYIYKYNNFPFFDKKIMMDIQYYHKRFTQGKMVVAQDDVVKNYRYQVFYWSKGKTYRAYYDKGKINQEECIYIHFKKRPNFSLDFDINNVEEFYITNNGFFPKNGEVCLNDIKKYNPYPGALYEEYENIKFYIIYYLTKLKNKIRRKLK